MNYFRSEFYRTIRIKALYILFILLIIFCILISLNFVNSIQKYSSADYTMFMLSIFTFTSFILAILTSSILNGRNLDILKQSISFGISKKNIYATKFFFSLGFLLLTLLLLVATSSLFSYYFFSDDTPAFETSYIKIINMLPLIISSLALSHWLNVIRVNGIMTVLGVFGVYIMSSDIVRLLDNLFFKKQILVNYFPANLLEKALDSSKFELQVFLIGVFFLLLFLILGYRSFSKKDVA